MLNELPLVKRLALVAGLSSLPMGCAALTAPGAPFDLARSQPNGEALQDFLATQPPIAREAAGSAEIAARAAEIAAFAGQDRYAAALEAYAETVARHTAAIQAQGGGEKSDWWIALGMGYAAGAGTLLGVPVGRRSKENS